MTARIPLVINSGAIQELQSGDSFNLGTGASLTSPTIATSMTLSYGTANQVQYLNGSKQLVGDADLTFDGTTLSVAAINVTTVDLTNLEVTNIKAKDGTAAITLADSTGVATFSANPLLNAGTANGVAYLNGSKVLTTGSALTFDGTNLLLGTTTSTALSSGQFQVGTTSADSAIQMLSSTTGTSGVYFGDGTTGDTRYRGGIEYGHNGDSLRFYASSAEQMRLTSTGLGIGTSSPSAKLDVTGTGLVSSFGSSTVAETYIQVRNGTSTLYLGGSSSYNYVYGTASVPLTFWTNSSERMRLDVSGNLGLGVTPSAWSTSGNIQMPSDRAIAYSGVYGQTGTNIYYNAGWKYYGTGAATLYSQETGKHIWFTAPSGTAGSAISFTQAMTLDASGNLGIGTSSPAANTRLTLSDANSVKLRLTNGSVQNGIVFDAVTATNIYYIGSGKDLAVGSDKGFMIWDATNSRAKLYCEDTVGETRVLGTTFQTFYTNGLERMRIDSSGNVGIGSTSPSSKLTCIGNGLFYNGGNAVQVSLDTATTTYDGGSIAQYGVSKTQTNGLVSTFGYNGLTFGTSGTERMRINTNGYVGIGNSNPQYGLHVSGGGAAGSAKIDVELYTGYGATFGASNVAVTTQIKTNTNWNYSGLDVWRNGSNTSTVRFIGMPLDGDSNSSTTVGGYNAIWGTYDSAPTTGSTSSALNGKMVYAAYAGHQWYTNGNERMRIDSSGNVLIGKITASDTTGVGAIIYQSGNFVTTYNTSSSINSYHLYNINATNNGYRFYVNVNGGINNYSGNNVNLSDERTKANIELSGDYLDKICAIPVKLFNYKDEVKGSQKTLGVIAQDVESVAPEFVNTDGWEGKEPADGIPLKSIYTTDMMFALMKSIQELKAELDATKAEVAALKGA